MAVTTVATGSLGMGKASRPGSGTRAGAQDRSASLELMGIPWQVSVVFPCAHSVAQIFGRGHRYLHSTADSPLWLPITWTGRCGGENLDLVSDPCPLEASPSGGGGSLCPWACLSDGWWGPRQEGRQGLCCVSFAFVE